MAELMFGLGQTKKKKESAAKVRTTKANLKDVTITETVVGNARAEQFDREKKREKESQRHQDEPPRSQHYRDGGN